MRDNDGNDQDTMTLRDRFAMAALPVVLKVNGWNGDSAESTVSMAYHFANAMMVVRAGIPYPNIERAKEPAPPAQCDIPECKGGPECTFGEPVPRTAEEERADVVADLRSQADRAWSSYRGANSSNESVRNGVRHETLSEALARVIAGDHNGAAERAKAGAK